MNMNNIIYIWPGHEPETHRSAWATRPMEIATAYVDGLCDEDDITILVNSMVKRLHEQANWKRAQDSWNFSIFSSAKITS